MARREVKGDDLLYRFFNEVLPREPELFKRIPRLLVLSMSIWFPKSVYTSMPVILPWVVRDPTCRGKRAKGVLVSPDAWASPNSDGYLRDDNSLVKGIPKSLRIESSMYTYLNGTHLGSEFVASHIWRENKTGILASRIPNLNTFVPNLVWLPSQVAKLSDREDGAVQTALKEISWSLYRDQSLEGTAKVIAEEAWGMLPQPENIQETLEKEVNWFVSTPLFLKTRKSKLRAVVETLEELADGGIAPPTLRPTRYRTGLGKVESEKRDVLLEDLRVHLGDVGSTGFRVEIDRPK
jgi:hypothetical protein